MHIIGYHVSSIVGTTSLLGGHLKGIDSSTHNSVSAFSYE